MSLAQASSITVLQSVKEILRDPLTGRKVMIPFTSKAFFEGSLQPTITSFKNNSNNNSGQEEQVLVKLSQHDLVEMTRDESIDLLEKRIQSVQAKLVKKKLTMAKNTSCTSSPKKKSAVNQTTNNQSPEESTTAASDSSFGFFEIREELDDQGNEIRAEAINVAKELEYLESEEGEKLDSIIRKPVVNDDDDDNDNYMIEEDSSNMNPNTTAAAADVLDSERLDAISLRLEELVKLEEEAEASRKINQTSAKKLQGQGWGRGFLNKSSKKKPQKAAVTPQQPQQQQQIKRTQSSSTDTVSSGNKTKQVGFREENNQIHEIPRVGERSIPQRPPTQLQDAAPSRQIDSKVFSGVIQERPAAVVQEQNKMLPAAADRQQQDAPRKVSRFAQQRMEQQGAQESAKRVSKFAQQRQHMR